MRLGSAHRRRAVEGGARHFRGCNAVRPVTNQRPWDNDVTHMERDGLREVCLGFPGAGETFPFGWRWSVFKVAGKMFALHRVDWPLHVSVKCEPVLALELRAGHPAILPGYHLNKRHWITVLIDGSLPDAMIAGLIEDSYDLVVSRLPCARRRELGWSRDAPEQAEPPD